MRSTRRVVERKKNSEPDPVNDAELGHYSDPPLQVLASLAEGPKHGHAMIEDIARLCGTRLGPGTLYGAIARLERQGWIEPLAPEERRRPYRITAEGLRVLRARLATLQHFVKTGTKRAGVERLEPR
jgi:DNA-binding PadR family transcriptional regulator